MAEETTYLIRGAAILGGDAEDLLIRDGVIAARGTGLSQADIKLEGIVLAARIDREGEVDTDRAEIGIVAHAEPGAPWIKSERLALCHKIDTSQYQ